MKISIRNAAIKDSESITNLSKQLGYISNNLDIQKRLIEILANKDNCVYVAIDKQKVIGWIHGFYSLRVESDSFVEIGGLVVDMDCRKIGVGEILVAKIHNWAQSKKCTKVRVRCNTIRKESHIFYEKIGFTHNKDQKIFDKNLS